jgi:hypothetical protein
MLDGGFSTGMLGGLRLQVAEGVLGTGSPGMLAQKKWNIQRKVYKYEIGRIERVWVRWVVSGSNKKDGQIACTLAPFREPVW